MVIRYASGSAYASIRICLSVSLSVYHPCRACIWGWVNCGPVNVYSIMRYNRCAGPACVVNFINSNRPVCNKLNICGAWACCISLVVINIGIINYSGIMYNIYHPGMRCIIIVYPRAVHITFRCAHPIIIGRVISTTY